MSDAAGATSLFEKLGGGPTVRVVVDAFYERVLADEELKPFFAETDMSAQKAHQAAFIGMALGGPSEAYKGREMATAHRGLGIEDRHFDAVAGHLAATLQASGVGPGDVGTILETVGTLRDAVVNGV